MITSFDFEKLVPGLIRNLAPRAQEMIPGRSRAPNESFTFLI